MWQLSPDTLGLVCRRAQSAPNLSGRMAPDSTPLGASSRVPMTDRQAFPLPHGASDATRRGHCSPSGRVSPTVARVAAHRERRHRDLRLAVCRLAWSLISPRLGAEGMADVLLGPLPIGRGQ